MNTRPTQHPHLRTPTGALTAIELIRRLIQLDPNTVICVDEHDYEYDRTFVYGVAAVGDDGVITMSQILTSWAGDGPLDPANDYPTI